MKKYYFITASISILFFVNCKKEVMTNDSVTTVDTVATKVVDTAALIQKAKEDMVNLAKPYDEKEDAQAKINSLVTQAKKEGKNVFVQAGGNWCIWCLRFNDFVQNNPKLKQTADDNYLYYHLNYSKENKNEAVFDKYAPNGKEYGFPFFFIIDVNGNVLDVVSSEIVANEGEGDAYYDEAKTQELFLKYAAQTK
jgi:thioredoxin-related protein